jgi:hypothetical protein
MNICPRPGEKFAARVTDREDDAGRIERAWQLEASASAAERAEGGGVPREGRPEVSGPAGSYARVVLRTNEFIYLD